MAVGLRLSGTMVPGIGGEDETFCDAASRSRWNDDEEAEPEEDDRRGAAAGDGAAAHGAWLVREGEARESAAGFRQPRFNVGTRRAPHPEGGFGESRGRRGFSAPAPRPRAAGRPVFPARGAGEESRGSDP